MGAPGGTGEDQLNWQLKCVFARIQPSPLSCSGDLGFCCSLGSSQQMGEILPFRDIEISPLTSSVQIPPTNDTPVVLGTLFVPPPPSNTPNSVFLERKAVGQ